MGNLPAHYLWTEADREFPVPVASAEAGMQPEPEPTPTPMAWERGRAVEWRD